MKNCLVRNYLMMIALILLLPGAANAQNRNDRRDDRRDDRSERIARVIRDCEDRTNDFKRAVEQSRRGSRRSDDLDRAASRLERELNRIRDSWNRDHDYGRTRSNVGGAIEAGKDVNRVLRRHELNSRVEREWGAIKGELNNLADVFERDKIRW